MPFNGNYPYAPGLTVAPSIQVGYIDATSTFTGNASLSVVPTYGEITGAMAAGASASIRLAQIALVGNSRVTITGQVRTGDWTYAADLTVISWVNGVAQEVATYKWLRGEQNFYQDLVLSGERVAVRLNTGETQRDFVELTLNLYVLSL